MTNTLKTAEQIYQHTLKDLVGVRYQIPTDLVYVKTDPVPHGPAHPEPPDLPWPEIARRGSV